MAVNRKRSRNAYKHGLAADKWAQVDWRHFNAGGSFQSRKSGEQNGQATRRAAEAREFLTCRRKRVNRLPPANFLRLSKSTNRKRARG